MKVTGSFWKPNLKKYDPEPHKRFVESVNRQREDSLLGKTKTDYTGDLEKPVYTGDLAKPDEDSDETIGKLLSRPLLAKRRKLLGM